MDWTGLYSPIQAALRDCCSALPPYRWIAGDEALELVIQRGRCSDDVATVVETVIPDEIVCAATSFLHDE